MKSFEHVTRVSSVSTSVIVKNNEMSYALFLMIRNDVNKLSFNNICFDL